MNWEKISIILVFLVAVLWACGALGEPLTASWYSEASCLAESGQCIMANGQPLDDSALTCASWDYRFGTSLKITNIDNGKSVIVTVTDRGPAKRLYKRGRVIDLSKQAFLNIADLKKGIINIKIEEL